MNQTNQITKLTLDEIENFIKKPLPPPIQFTDRNYNGDFGLLPTELWNKIYDMKYELEKKELKELKEKRWELDRSYDSSLAISLYIKYRQLYSSETFYYKNIKHFINNHTKHSWKVSEPNIIANKIWVKRFLKDNFLQRHWNEEEGFNFGSGKYIEFENLIEKVINQKRPRKETINRFNELVDERLQVYYMPLRDNFIDGDIDEDIEFKLKPSIDSEIWEAFIEQQIYWEDIDTFTKDAPHYKWSTWRNTEKESHEENIKNLKPKFTDNWKRICDLLKKTNITHLEYMAL